MWRCSVKKVFRELGAVYQRRSAEEFFLTSVFWFVFLATAKNEQETQSKAQIIRDCYYSEKTKNKKCMVLKFELSFYPTFTMEYKKFCNFDF